MFLYNSLFFFIILSVIVTVSCLIILQPLNTELYVDIHKTARLNFLNIVFISFFGAFLNNWLKKYTLLRPLKRILAATRQLTKGDFSTRIVPFNEFYIINEFNDIIEDFNKMAEELGNIGTLRTDFINNVSHELKTPLAIIQNYSVMMQTSGILEEKKIEYAKIISNTTSRLSGLITNILKMNNLENQQIFTINQKYNLGEQLRECLLSFEDSWEAKNIEIDIDIDEVTIKADEELMILVWNNIFSNAVKFTNPGGRISVRLKEDYGNAIVEVADTGCGMTKEVCKRIFEKFYQGDMSHSIQGNGLGLALVKRIIDIVDGEILVKSSPGIGSKFTIRLHKDIEQKRHSS